MKKLLLSVINFLVVSALTAQPVLTNSNHTPRAGQSFISLSCDTTVHEGNAGANQVWDFNTLEETGDITNVDYMLPSQTPYGGDFPSANLAALLTGSILDIYDYFYADFSAWKDVGAASLFSKIVNVKPQVLISYPFSYDSLWLDTINETYSGGNTIYSVNETKGDAFGTLHLRGITFENVLRIKHIDSSVYYYPGIGNQTRIDTSYTWYDTIHQNPLLIIRYIQSRIDGQGEQSVKSVSVYQNITGGIPSPGYNILSVRIYPNPSFGALNISYQTELLSDFALDIYDVLGRKIISRSEKNQPPGNHSSNFNDLNEGIYFLKLKAGDELNSQKFIVIK